MSGVPTNVTVFCVTIIILGVIYILAKEFQSNKKILRQESFYKGKNTARGKWSFLLPLFLHRRRRRTNGKKLATIKHMHQL